MSRVFALITRTVREFDVEFGAGSAARDTRAFGGMLPFAVIALYAVVILFEQAGV